MTKPITDAELAMIHERRNHWNKYPYKPKGDELISPAEYDAIRERLRLAEAVINSAERSVPPEMHQNYDNCRCAACALFKDVTAYRAATRGEEKP